MDSNDNVESKDNKLLVNSNTKDEVNDDSLPSAESADKLEAISETEIIKNDSYQEPQSNNSPLENNEKPLTQDNNEGELSNQENKPEEEQQNDLYLEKGESSTENKHDKTPENIHERNSFVSVKSDERSNASDSENYSEEDRSNQSVSKEQVTSENSTSATAKEEEQQKIREERIEQYRQAVMEHKLARETNLQLQTKLAEYFRRKKADAADQQSALSSVGGSTTDNVVDYEQRYNKYIISLMELRNQYNDLQDSYQKQIKELEIVCAQKQKEVDEGYNEYINYKLQVGRKALHGKAGRLVNQKDLLAMISAEQKKEAAVMEVRLENIKLRNEVAKIEALLRSKEELAEGLHLIDFEQLKIENQTYNEKIEERNEELEKLKRKISSTVQIMAHVKEKLQSVQCENAKQRERLALADSELSYNRDHLTKLKQTRDRLRAENIKLRRSCGLLGKTDLLLNYEASVDAVKAKKAALDETKKITKRYITQTKSLINKIEKHPDKNNVA